MLHRSSSVVAFVSLTSKLRNPMFSKQPCFCMYFYIRPGWIGWSESALGVRIAWAEGLRGGTFLAASVSRKSNSALRRSMPVISNVIFTPYVSQSI